MISNYVLIIGAMKSGTTTLYNYLARHPQIAPGIKKEPAFFAFEEIWAQGLDWYDSQFDYDPRRHLYALDASTDYTKHPFCQNVADRIRASAPRQFKLIYIMRHPLRRIESQALHAQLTKAEIGSYPSPRKNHSFDSGISPVAIAISRYAYQIDIFSEYYDKGQLLLLTLEQLMREPKNVLEKVFEFLEIDQVISGDTSLKSNVADSHYPPHQIWQDLYAIAPLRRIVTAVIPRVVRERIYRTAVLSGRPRGRFTLNADEEVAITSLLAPDLVRLRDRYGIDAEKEWGIVI